MAAALVGGAALGAVFGELMKAVLEMKDKVIMFKPTLADLRSNLEAIAPVIREIEQHNNELGRPKEELETLIREMEEARKLVCKCSKIHRLNYLAKARYQDQLAGLLTSLMRFIIIEMQAQTARDQKETLLEVRRILSKVDKLPFGSTEDATDLESDPVLVDVSESEIHDTMETQPNENAVGTDSTDQVMEHITQLIDIAERLLIGATRNVKSPSLASFVSNPGSNEVSNALIDQLNIQSTSSESELSVSNNQLLSNGSSTISNRNAGNNKPSQPDATSRNGSKTKDSESRNEIEWVLQNEPGIYIFLTSLPGDVIDLKKVSFSRKRFTEKQAEQWWAENRERVYEQYNLKDMAKRLPVGAARNVKSPSLASFGSYPGSNEVSSASINRLHIQVTSPEPELTGSNNQLLSNGSSTISNSGAGHTKQSKSDVTSRSRSKTNDSESRNEIEWVEQYEPGVYIYITSLPGAVIYIKKVRFSRKRFNQEQVEQWWAENWARICEQYNVRMTD